MTRLVMRAWEREMTRASIMHKGYTFTMDCINSYMTDDDTYNGYYLIGVTEPVMGLTAWYTFTGRDDFRTWVDGVVLD